MTSSLRLWSGRGDLRVGRSRRNTDSFGTVTGELELLRLFAEWRMESVDHIGVCITHFVQDPTGNAC